MAMEETLGLNKPTVNKHPFIENFTLTEWC